MAAAKLVKTTTPGIYRRHAKSCPRSGRCDCAYVVVYNGQATTYRTLSEAREGKSIRARQAKLSHAHASGLHRDEPQDACPGCQRDHAARDAAEPMLHDYVDRWIKSYHGTGRRGFREETRAEYRTLLSKYALTFFPADMRLRDVRPREIADMIAWLMKQPNGAGGQLTDKSVRNALGPFRACLASAKREGLIPDNPAVGAALPHRARIEEDDELPQPFPGDTMEMVVSIVHPDHRVMFELLAATGVRRSELLGLEVRHLALDGAQPSVRVRQRTRWQKGQGQVIGPLKSAYARRDLPIAIDVADRLRAHVAGRDPNELAFPSPTGRPYDPSHIWTRVLAPACAEAGVEWAGFHTFRHTVASRMFAAGRNAVQVQAWLGHHSAAFTLKTYVHLLDPGDLGGPLEPAGVKKRSRSGPETAGRAGLGRIS